MPMCGIYGILSTPGEPRPASADDYFGEVSRLLAYRPSGQTADLETAYQTLEAAKEQGYLLTGRAGFLTILEDRGVRKKLAETAKSLRDWVKDLENRAAQGGSSVGRNELLNALIVGGQDLAWQAERDLLENVEPLERLLAGDELTRRVLGHGWHLNLILNNL